MEIIMFKFQYSVKVVYVDGPVLQCQGICCHYADLSFMLIWWLRHRGSHASIFTFVACTLKRLWFFKGCLWDECLCCLRYIIGDLVWYLFLIYGLIEMFSVSIQRKSGPWSNTALYYWLVHWGKFVQHQARMGLWDYVLRSFSVILLRKSFYCPCFIMYSESVMVFYSTI